LDLDAEESSSTAMRSFAAGLRMDLDAVRAGLTKEWTNGCVEGFIHKLLKCQGYGRAGFELLRRRLGLPSWPSSNQHPVANSSSTTI
jgi:transposase